MRTSRAFVVGLFSSLVPLSLAAQVPPAPPASGRAAAIAAAREVMRKAHYCSFITNGEDGQPQARIMDPFAPDEGLTVWLATKPVTRKVAQIRRNPRVTLLYFDPAAPAYVTLLGTAELVADPAEKARRWKEAWVHFYKDRSRGDDYLLIRVKPSRLEIVDYGRGLVGDPETWRPVTVDLR